ncbi:MAG: glutamate-1-semialdehyde 2,1-aminomutase [Thermodesulfobacteriota bacterium]|nr:glutamate-1-semialdehyde 2,1-aminomutase [Thermodesulfobacteriota bacterium]
MANKSKELFLKAQEIIPGGVNSPVRAGRSVGVDPPFIQRADGCHLWDVDGKRYIDYISSWGPMILGHRHPEVIQGINSALENGTSYGAPTELELNLAKTIVEAIPSVEMVRMVNSGTEATMSAIRLARGFTGKDMIIKFDGCYHGHSDSCLVAAGSGLATLGIPGSPGVPDELAKLTVSLPFNNLRAVELTVKKYSNQIAAIIVEPVAGNMGVVLPENGFLEGLRRITTEKDILLIFDEVITGFRVSPGGAQKLYNIMPDITCLGKIIGGGLPVGAYGGKKDIMSHIAPTGNIYQAGTLSGNPLAMSAGLATLIVLKNKEIYGKLNERSKLLFNGLIDAAKRAGVDVVANRVGSMGTIFFTDKPVYDFNSAKQSDSSKYSTFYREMLAQKIYLAPSPFEAMFLSLAHSEDIIKKTIDCAFKSFKKM